jgi:hypothetical protein
VTHKADLRPRLLILTDIGGDPDDQQSLVRLLVHSNEFQIEAIIPEQWSEHKQTPEEQMARVRGCLAAYGQVRDNLALHARGYPSEGDLQGVLKRGKTGVPFSLDRDTVPDVSQIVGPGLETEGSQWIVNVVDRPDPRPIDVNVWGGTADLAQALWTVREQRSPDELAAFVAKIRVHAIGDQDDTGPWIRHHFPGLFYVLDHARDGNKMHSCYRGMFLGGDESLTSRAWIDAHVRHDHGPLGALYPPKTWTGPNPHGALKEGDTPSWFYFYPNGLNVPSHPWYGGWGGRFAPNGAFYQDAQDAVGEESSGRATVWRWRPAFQNEFQARMDWCVSDYESANHKPHAVIHGDVTRRAFWLLAEPGDALTLDASASSDPDGDNLRFRWWVYPEAGTYRGAVTISGGDSPTAALVVPRDAAGAEMHVILEVSDDGLPPLKSYRRVIVTTEE